MAQIELIARAVIQRDDRILLAHKIGESNIFLPGGHVDYGEFTDDALKRELREELGVEAVIGEFMGTLEYMFTEENGEPHHEINFIFETSITEMKIESKEKHLEFLWISPDDLIKHNLLPSSLPSLLKKWIEKRTPFHYKGKDQERDSNNR